MKRDLLYPLRRFHGYLYELKQFYLIRSEYKHIFKENPKTFFLLMTPEHGNIGDQAIAIAEKRFLKGLGLNIIEKTSAELQLIKSSKKLNTFDGFPLLINGGGNLGTLWPEVENLQRDIIQNNPHSVIAFLPNTIYYENNEEGKSEFEKSKKIYNKHKKLYLYAREKTSYKLMKEAYRNVKLVPDMVLSLDPYSNNSVRNGCLLCFRSDIEKTMSEAEEEQILGQVKKLFSDNYKYTDMIAEHSISTKERENAVIDKLNEFCGAELVITDRLHGMILCAITGTPCIVVNSKSPKVKGCYEWIKHLAYIGFADNLDEIADVYKQLQKDNCLYDNSNLKDYYKKLGEDILTLPEY